MENKSTSRMLLQQSTTQTDRETTRDNGNINADLSTNLVAAAASLDTTDLEKQETTYSQVPQQTETKHSCQDHTLEDTLICSKQMNDGQVPEALQHVAAATKVGNSSDWDYDLEEAMNNVTDQNKKVDADGNKYAAVQHQQPQDSATMPTVTTSARPPRPLVLPASAADSVRRHYVSPTLQATTSRLISHSAVNSLSRQSNDVNNASSAQPEDLPVAVPAEEVQIHVYADSHNVSQHEVRKRVQMVRARRDSCRLYFVVFLLVAAAVVIALVVVLKKNKSYEQEQETEMMLLQNMTQLIKSIMDADAVLLNDALSPYAKALTWLLQSNERNKSQEMTSTLAQRFYLASFYYDTTTDDDKWTYCNPPNSLLELDQTCTEQYSNTTRQAWLSDSHECEWAGVRCDNHQQIRGLAFKDMNLVGTIPSSIAKFPFFESLWFTSSQLEGNISLLSDCHHLTWIVLTDNLLSGDLSSIWQHRKLAGFIVGSNHITGSLSSQIGNLVDIKLLYLYNNELTGTVPSEVSLLDSIYHFDISKNHFRGELPQSMQFWSMIDYITVSGNNYSGSIPTFLGQLNQTLFELELNDNHFTGTLPDELFHLTDLFWLDVSNNELSGTLDARFAQWTKSQWKSTLYVLYLSGNHFTGTIPTELGLLVDLHSITLQGNKFTGSVPSSLCLNQFDLDFTFIADCAKDDNGQVELKCDCCTSCCQDDGTQCVSNI